MVHCNQGKKQWISVSWDLENGSLYWCVRYKSVHYNEVWLYCDLFREPSFTVSAVNARERCASRWILCALARAILHGQYCECPWKMWPRWILWALSRAVLHGRHCECPWKMCFSSNTVSPCESRPSRTIYTVSACEKCAPRWILWPLESDRVKMCITVYSRCVLCERRPSKWLRAVLDFVFEKVWRLPFWPTVQNFFPLKKVQNN